MKARIESQRLQALARACAPNKKIKVKVGQAWRTDGKVIEVAPLKGDDYNAAKGLLNHEVGHVKFSDMSKNFFKQVGRNKLLHACCNVIEDIFVENKMIAEYDGADGFLKHAINGFNADPEHVVKFLAEPSFSQKLKYIYCKARGYEGFPVEFPAMDHFADAANKITKSSPETTLALARELFEALKDEYKQEKQKQREQQREQEKQERQQQQQQQQQQDEQEQDEDAEQDQGAGAGEDDPDDENAENEDGEKQDEQEQGGGGDDEDAEQDEDEQEQEQGGGGDDADEDEQDEDDPADDEDEQGGGGADDEDEQDEDEQDDSDADGADDDSDEDEDDEDGEDGAGDSDSDDDDDSDEDEQGGGKGGKGGKGADEDENDEDDETSDEDEKDAENGEQGEQDEDDEQGDPADEDEKDDYDYDKDFDDEVEKFDMNDIWEQIQDAINKQVDEIKMKDMIAENLEFEHVDAIKIPDVLTEFFNHPTNLSVAGKVEMPQDAVRKLVARLQTVMLDEARVRRLGGQKRGKLHGKALHKTKAGNYDVFSKKSRGLDTSEFAVAIMVDCSGSMSEGNFTCEKMQHAKTTAFVLGETMHRLGIKTAMYGFSSIYKGRNEGGTGETPLLISVKEFDQSWEQGKAGLNNLIVMRYNFDANSIFQVYDRLMQVPAKNKILLVISDGQPNPENPEILKRTIEMISRSIRVIGFGLNHGKIGHFYPESVVCRPNDLAQKMVTVMRRLLFQKVTGKRVTSM